jgi:hypothetical protein
MIKNGEKTKAPEPLKDTKHLNEKVGNFNESPRIEIFSGTITYRTINPQKLIFQTVPEPCFARYSGLNK